MSRETTHPTSELLQAYLEEELATTRRAEVEAHLGECRRCAAELEGWALLFRELDELPALGPSPAFRERVLAEVPARATRAEGARAGLWRRLVAAVTGAGRHASGHLSPERIQELADDVLSGRRRRRAHAHIAACGDCRAEVHAWQALFREIEGLPELAPSDGFAPRVLAALGSVPASGPARAPTAAWKRLPAAALVAARRLVPSTRKGWALAGGAVAAPAVAVAAGLGAVIAHPLLTLGDLAAFLWWRAGDVAGGAGSWVLGRLVESPVTTWLWTVGELGSATPQLAVGGLIFLWAATLAAAWVLYRNVVQPHFAVERHVR